MRIEHEADQRTLQLCTQTRIHCEARTGDLCRAFEIEDVQFRSKVPVRLRFEIKLPWLADAAHLDVVISRAAVWNRLMRKIRDTGKAFAKALIQLLYALVQRGDAL